MGIDTLHWAMTGYSLVSAAVIIASGSLGPSSDGSESSSSACCFSLPPASLIAPSSSGGPVIAERAIPGAAVSTIQTWRLRRRAARFGRLQAVELGSLVTVAGFPVVIFTDASWRYGALVLVLTRRHRQARGALADAAAPA